MCIRDRNKNGEEKLYFVLETKGDTSFMHLKTSEQLKIDVNKRQPLGNYQMVFYSL